MSEKMNANSKYKTYPFTSDKLIWHENNKAIIKIKNPCYPHLPRYNQEYYYCGYVLFEKNKLPKKWHKGNYRADHIDMLAIHGGLTYGEEDGNYVVFGFDTNHAGDNENPELQNLEYIIKITRQMEDQLEIHANSIKEYRKLKTIEEKAAYLDKIKETAKYNVAPNYFGIFCFGAQDDE